MLNRLMANIWNLYGWRAPTIFVNLFVQAGYRPGRYLLRFWQVQNFATVSRRPIPFGSRLLAYIVLLGMGLQVIAGVYLAVYGAVGHTAWLWFGLATLVAYPLVWAHLLLVIAVLGLPFRLKRLGKAVVCRILERQVRRLRRRHQFAVVAVAGSVGKTSTKLAVANALSVTRRVRYQAGNYNDRLTVPLVVFGQDEPGLYNLLAWLRIFRQNRRVIRSDFPYDIVVVELGTDGPGQMAQFAYLKPDVAILTAVAPEHMEQFGTMATVAAEELTIFEYTERVIVNIDDVAAEYLANREYVSYGNGAATYELVSTKPAKRLGKQQVTFRLAGQKLSQTIDLIGQPGAKIALAAAAAASELALPVADIKTALSHLRPFAGRMQILPGIKHSTIIDDTYNASPVAVTAALDLLQSTDASQHIAIIGSMNEMGESSRAVHQEAGEQCDPKRLDLVVTVGREARDYLAPAAIAAGCTVESFLSPYEAGEFVCQKLKQGALILAKGSQNGVFAEEALKSLLKNPDDADKLVRQSAAWMAVKRRQFGA